jgi:alkylation response protein AidB-like acyl-CoA dehydrogenase
MLGEPDAAAALAPGADGGWDLVELGGGADPVNTWDLTRRVLRVDLSGRPRLARIADGRAVETCLARHVAMALASDSTGAARAILEQTIDYMKERRQFDRTIASFQALKHRAADLMALVISGEEIMGLAVNAVARGGPEADVWAMLAKARQTDAYVQVATECLQLHGGVGFTWEFDAHIHLKRARLNQTLGAPNTTARDAAAERLADAARAGRSVLELV